MNINSKVLDNGVINCRVRIDGKFNGEDFTYVDPVDGFSQYIHTDGDPSSFWWEEGNMACDCNRRRFLPEHLKALVPDECGNKIDFYRIVPLDTDLPILEFDEIKTEDA